MNQLPYRIVYFIFGVALLVVFAPALYFGLNPVPSDSPSSIYYSMATSENWVVRELHSLADARRRGQMLGVGILGSFIGIAITIFSSSRWFHFLFGFIGVGSSQNRKNWLIFLLGALALAVFLLYYTIEYHI